MSGVQDPLIDPGVLHEGEGLDQPLHRPILRPIRDHDDLELRVVQGEEGSHACHDAPLFVEGRDQDRYRHVQVSLQEIPQSELRQLSRVGPDRAQPQVSEQRVQEVEGREVGQDDELDHHVGRGPAVHAVPLSSGISRGMTNPESRSTWEAISRAKRSGWNREALARTERPLLPRRSRDSAEALRTHQLRSPNDS